jgi:N-acyl-D-aspartate/D-glutamate deacylase
MLDLAIRGAEVVDGTGGPRRRADVGVRDGRIVSVGEVGESRRTVEADGCIVAPGFCDVHTHFDAQVFWDGALTPSSQHGVTTVMAGNCGFTLAPMAPDAADYLVRMLAVVEGMPLDALRAGVPLDWASTADYLDRIEGTLAVNSGFMVGHSAMRRVVMGPAATERAARPEELDTMVRLLRDGLEAGGMGFSSSWGVAHRDGDGAPVPSRSAPVEELLALSAVCREFAGTSLEFLPPRVDTFDEDLRDLVTALSRAAGRPLNWNVMRATSGSTAASANLLAAGQYARDHEAAVVALTMPIPSRARFSFGTGFVLDILPDWAPVMALPPAERLAALGRPEVRRRLHDGAASAPGPLGEIAQWGARVISQTFDPDLAGYQGRLVADIAREEGKDPLDALLDIACADGLRTTFTRVQPEPTREDWEAAVAVWRDPGAVIGASDAGAHLDFTAYFDYPVYVLEHAVRQHGVLGLEEAVHLLTEVPARLYGLVDRGRIVEGGWADLVVFDESTVGPGTLETRFDLPAGAGRLYAEPEGVHHVVVNGEPIVLDGRLTGARPGRVLRSGRDSRTPDLG